MTSEQEHELTLLMTASQRGDRSAYEALLHGLGHVVRLYVCRRVGETPWVGAMHLLLWHAGPVMVVVLSAAVFGRAMFTAFAARSEGRR